MLDSSLGSKKVLKHAIKVLQNTQTFINATFANLSGFKDLDSAKKRSCLRVKKEEFKSLVLRNLKLEMNKKKRPKKSHSGRKLSMLSKKYLMNAPHVAIVL